MRIHSQIHVRARGGHPGCAARHARPGSHGGTAHSVTAHKRAGNAVRFAAGWVTGSEGEGGWVHTTTLESTAKCTRLRSCSEAHPNLARRSVTRVQYAYDCTRSVRGDVLRRSATSSRIVLLAPYWYTFFQLATSKLLAYCVLFWRSRLRCACPLYSSSRQSGLHTQFTCLPWLPGNLCIQRMPCFIRPSPPAHTQGELLGHVSCCPSLLPKGAFDSFNE